MHLDGDNDDDEAFPWNKTKQNVISNNEMFSRIGFSEKSLGEQEILQVSVFRMDSFSHYRN